MKRRIKISIIGDFNPDYPSHIAINKSLLHAAGALSLKVDYFWLPTESLKKISSETSVLMSQSDAIWVQFRQSLQEHYRGASLHTVCSKGRPSVNWYLRRLPARSGRVCT